MANALTIVPDLEALKRLPIFDDREVSRTAIKVTNAGDGLSAALQVDPQAFHLGEKVYVVLETVVSKVEHAPAVDGDTEGPLVRSHVLRAGAATIVDEDLVAEQIRVQTVRIKAAEEAAKEKQHGIKVLPGTGWQDEDGDDEGDSDGPAGLYDDPETDD